MVNLNNDVKKIMNLIEDNGYQVYLVGGFVRDLIIGKEYLGSCRNSERAIWNGKCFEYERYKWGTTYIDEINHFEDDDGYDLFVPIKEI